MKKLDNPITDFLFARNALDEISSVANILLHLLNNVEDAMAFARLKIIHNSILSSEDLNFIIQKLFKYYPANGLFFKKDVSDVHKYYDLIDIESYQSIME